MKPLSKQQLILTLQDDFAVIAVTQSIEPDFEDRIVVSYYINNSNFRNSGETVTVYRKVDFNPDLINNVLLRSDLATFLNIPDTFVLRNHPTVILGQ